MAYPSLKFIFDGATKTAIGRVDAVVDGVFSFSATELYSDWCDWVANGDNLKYSPAFRTVGGDPIGGGVYIGSYIFFRNDLGWRGSPPDINSPISVIIDGNFFPENPALPWFMPVAGETTSITMRTSSSTQAISTTGGTTTCPTPPTTTQISDAVWQANNRSLTINPASLSDVLAAVHSK